MAVKVYYRCFYVECPLWNVPQEQVVSTIGSIRCEGCARSTAIKYERVKGLRDRRKV